MGTTMASTDTTITDAALLQLIWLASPALPVGGFSYSEGLEAAVESGLVRDEVTAGDWLVDQLQLSLARGDLAVLCAAVQACRDGDAARIAALDAWVRATRETSEMRQQTEQMGRSLREWERSLDPALSRIAGVAARTQPTGGTQPTADSRTYPVAFAEAAAARGGTVRQIALTFAFGWSENMMQSAIKAVPLGQGAGQRILARLAQQIPAAVDHALALDDDSRQAFAPMLAILSAQHETQYSRLFRS
jgi:urease accessory protein